jgi:hypothetical protein
VPFFFKRVFLSKKERNEEKFQTVLFADPPSTDSRLYFFFLTASRINPIKTHLAFSNLPMQFEEAYQSAINPYTGNPKPHLLLGPWDAQFSSVRTAFHSLTENAHGKFGSALPPK